MHYRSPAGPVCLSCQHRRTGRVGSSCNTPPSPVNALLADCDDSTVQMLRAPDVRQLNLLRIPSPSRATAALWPYGWVQRPPTSSGTRLFVQQSMGTCKCRTRSSMQSALPASQEAFAAAHQQQACRSDRIIILRERFRVSLLAPRPEESSRTVPYPGMQRGLSAPVTAATR